MRARGRGAATRARRGAAAPFVAALLVAAVAACSKPAAGNPLPPRATETLCLANLDLDRVDETMPALLSETGCLTDVPTRTPAADLLPYGVNAELWTDGAHKERFLAVPHDATVTLTETGPWRLPVGTKIIKHFLVDRAIRRGADATVGPDGAADADAGTMRNASDYGAPERVAVETRFMVLGTGGWRYFSYRWNEEGTDATLRGEGMASVERMDVWIGDNVRSIVYQFPDRFSCTTCHGEAPGEVIGLRTRQLNGRFNYGGVRANQITALAGIGLFGADPAKDAGGGDGADDAGADVDRASTFDPKKLPSQPNPYGKSGTLEARARAYLDTHCASCHQPGGWTAADILIDMRYETPFADTNLCGVESLYPYPGGTGRRRIAPGHPEDSNLLGRMSVEGVGEIGEMPPIGRSIRDEAGVALIREWILSLRGCPEGSTAN